MTDTSFLAELLDEAIAAGEAKIPDLVAPLVERAAKNGTLVIEKLPEALRPLAQKVLDAIANHADALGSLSQKTVVGLVAKLEIGQGEQAQLVYLRTTATHAERMAALDEDSAATRAQATDRNAAWQKFKSFAEEIGLAAGKAAIPILLAL